MTIGTIADFDNRRSFGHLNCNKFKNPRRGKIYFHYDDLVAGQFDVDHLTCGTPVSFDLDQDKWRARNIVMIPAIPNN